MGKSADLLLEDQDKVGPRRAPVNLEVLATRTRAGATMTKLTERRRPLFGR